MVVDKIINMVSLSIPWVISSFIGLMLLVILVDTIRTILLGERAGEDKFKLQIFIDYFKGDK